MHGSGRERNQTPRWKRSRTARSIAPRWGPRDRYRAGYEQSSRGVAGKGVRAEGRGRRAWREARESGFWWKLRPGTNWPPPAPAPIRTRGPGEQTQPNLGQRRGNQVSARNLPALTRSTRSRHRPQLPARRTPRLPPRLLEGGAPGRPASGWAGLAQDKSLLLPGSRHLSSLWAASSGLRSFRWAGLGIRSPRPPATPSCGVSYLPRVSATCSAHRSARWEFTV